MTAIALVLRYYKGAITWTDVWERMTIRCFNVMFEEIVNVSKLEFPDEEEKSKPVSLTGKKGVALAKRLIPKGKR